MPDAGHRGTPDLIDRGALLKKLRDERDAYINDNFVTDPTPGASESSPRKEEYLNELDERIEAIEQFPAAHCAHDDLVAALRELNKAASEFQHFFLGEDGHGPVLSVPEGLNPGEEQAFTELYAALYEARDSATTALNASEGR